MTSISVSSSSSSTANLFFQPVLGKGREQRWDQFVKLFHEKIEPLYGSQSGILERIKDNKDYTSRLLCSHDEPKGLLVYSRAMNQNLSEQGFPSSIEIKYLYVDDQASESARNRIARSLLSFLRVEAKANRAMSITIRFPKVCTDLEKIFTHLAFKGLRNFSDPDVTYALKLDTEPMQREKRQAEIDDDESYVRVDDGTNQRNDDSNNALAEDKRRRVSDTQSSGSSFSNGQRSNASFSSHSSSSGSGLGSLSSNFARSPSSLSSSSAPRMGSHVSDLRRQYEPAPRSTSCPIMKKYLTYIQQGRKTVEGRINSGMFARLRVGETLVFMNQDLRVPCKITKINQYATFADMLRNDGVPACLPDVTDLNQAIDIYRKIPGYAQKEAQFGVLAIHIQKI
jgi:ASC-1-like (ASCH) protein